MRPTPFDLRADLATAEDALRGCDAVLLDLGGVLVPDGWEAIVLADGGIADRYGIDREVAHAVGRAIWDEFADRPRTAGEYRAALAAALGLEAGTIPEAIFEAIAEAVTLPLPAGIALLDACRGAGVAIGVITDNAAFLFERQARVLGMDAWLEPALRYTSHETGLRKKHGLFEHARAATAGRPVLVIDDRPASVERATAAGFRALRFPGSAPLTARRPARRC